MGNVWLTKRANGVWYARFRRDGKEVWRSLRTKERGVARRKAAALGLVLEEGGGEVRRRLLPGEAWERYVALRGRAISEGTLESKRRAWGSFWGQVEATYLDEVTAGMVALWQEALQVGFEASTVNLYLTQLGSVWSVLLDAEELEGKNPVTRVSALPVPRAQPRFLGEGEVWRLLEASRGEEDLHVFIALGVLAGMRRGEILHARWGWVHWPASGATGHILIPGREDQRRGTWEAKSRRARAVPLMGALQEILLPRRGLDQGLIVAPFLATRYPAQFGTRLGALAAGCGLEGVTPHVLRHTFASLAAQRGVALYKVSQWLGHANITTTQIYAHLRVDDPDIDRVMGGSGPGAAAVEG